MTVHADDGTPKRGYTKLPHSLEEGLMNFGRMRLSGRERAILDVVLRYTDGWRRSTSRIPDSMLARMTGIKALNCRQIVASLSQRGILYRDDKGHLGLCKNPAQWKPKERKKAKDDRSKDGAVLEIKTAPEKERKPLQNESGNRSENGAQYKELSERTRGKKLGDVVSRKDDENPNVPNVPVGNQPTISPDIPARITSLDLERALTHSDNGKYPSASEILEMLREFVESEAAKHGQPMRFPRKTLDHCQKLQGWASRDDIRKALALLSARYAEKPDQIGHLQFSIGAEVIEKVRHMRNPKSRAIG